MANDPILEEGGVFGFMFGRHWWKMVIVIVICTTLYRIAELFA